MSGYRPGLPLRNVSPIRSADARPANPRADRGSHRDEDTAHPPCPTWMRTGGCGSTRWPAFSRTSPSTTSPRPAGGCRTTCGSCAAIQLDVLEPFAGDTEVELTTWCSGVAAIAAGRRWSLKGDAGGHIEVDSVWIHLDAEQRPARIEDFGVYADAAAGRHVSTKLALPDPPPNAPRTPWPLRVTDVDLHGHVNNAVHWQAVEDTLTGDGPAASGARLPAADRSRRRPRARTFRQLPGPRDRRRRQGRRPRHAYLSRSFSRRPSAMASPTTIITARYATWTSVDPAHGAQRQGSQQLDAVVQRRQRHDPLRRLPGSPRAARTSQRRGRAAA